MGHLNVKQLEKAEEKALYIKYLINDLKALDIMLNKNVIEKTPIRIGAEQEFCIVKENYFPNDNCLELL